MVPPNECGIKDADALPGFEVDAVIVAPELRAQHRDVTKEHVVAAAVQLCPVWRIPQRYPCHRDVVTIRKAHELWPALPDAAVDSTPCMVRRTHTDATVRTQPGEKRRAPQTDDQKGAARSLLVGVPQAKRTMSKCHANGYAQVFARKKLLSGS